VLASEKSIPNEYFCFFEIQKLSRTSERNNNTIEAEISITFKASLVELTENLCRSFAWRLRKSQSVYYVTSLKYTNI